MVGFVALGGDGSLDGNESLENKDFNVGMVGFVALGDDGSLENNDSNVGMVGFLGGGGLFMWMYWRLII